MRKRLLTLWPVAAALALGACATLNKEQCLSGDWRQIGRADGANGYTVERLEEHREACAEFGVGPNERAYRQGRDEGLVHYCTGARGYAEGKAGNGYRHVCPPQQEAEFLRNFRIGSTVHDFNQKIARLDEQIRSKEKALEQTPERDRQGDKQNDRQSDEQRRWLRESIRALRHERAELESAKIAIELISLPR